MNVSYLTSFFMRLIIPLYLFISYFFISHSKLTLVIAILAMIQVLAFGWDVYKKGNWNKINLQHDQRTRENALLAGNIIYWGTICFLLIGTLLIQHNLIPMSFPEFVGYLILISLVIRLAIRDYLNNHVGEVD